MRTLILFYSTLLFARPPLRVSVIIPSLNGGPEPDRATFSTMRSGLITEISPSDIKDAINREEVNDIIFHIKLVQYSWNNVDSIAEYVMRSRMKRKLQEYSMRLRGSPCLRRGVECDHASIIQIITESFVEQGLLFRNQIECCSYDGIRLLLLELGKKVTYLLRKIFYR